MRVRLPLLVGAILTVTAAASSALYAERPLAAMQVATTGDGMTLTEAEMAGKKMFQQRCSICHTDMMLTGRGVFGGVLTSDNVEDDREARARDRIARGSPRMPGFQYTLEPREIENILLYLKKIPGKSSETRN